MNDLLKAARAALPGAAWLEVDGGAEAEIGGKTAWLLPLRSAAPEYTHCALVLGEWQRFVSADFAGEWLRDQVEARRAALTAALGGGRVRVDDLCIELAEARKEVAAVADRVTIWMDRANELSAELLDVTIGRAALTRALKNIWIPVGERLPDLDRNVPLWTDRGMLFGSRGLVDSKTWLWADLTGDTEAFADVVVTHWLDLQPPKGIDERSERP